jgi:hypothetical protein
MTTTEPSFRVARIVYFPDLTRADARVIPLGSLSEVILTHTKGLALKARTALSVEELNLLSPLIRKQLINPFLFLRGEFEKAWENGADNALEFLASRQASSLSVLAPTDYPGRKWLLRRLLPPREDVVISTLSEAVGSEFAELFKKYGKGVVAERTIVERSRRAA